MKNDLVNIPNHYLLFPSEKKDNLISQLFKNPIVFV